jgi:hypothetical protein
MGGALFLVRSQCDKTKQTIFLYTWISVIRKVPQTRASGSKFCQNWWPYEKWGRKQWTSFLKKGTKLVVWIKSVLAGVSPPTQFWICLTCRSTAARIVHYIKVSSEQDPANLLNWYSVSWTSTFADFTLHSNWGWNTEYRIKLEPKEQGSFPDNFNIVSQAIVEYIYWGWDQEIEDQTRA